MEKEFASIFESNKDISLDEYEINKLLDKTIEINENEFPVISIGNSDKESPKIYGTITTKEYEEKDNSANVNLEEDGIEITNNAYSEEETKKYKNLQETLSLSEDDIEVAGEIVDAEIDMSKLFPNADNLTKEETSIEEESEKTSELTEEQAEIINNIYSKEENDIHKESEDESLEGYELSNIETVEDFNLDESFKKTDDYEDLLYNQLEDDTEDLDNTENIEYENVNAEEEELKSLEDTIKELRIDNEEDVDIEDLIGTENLSILEEDLKDENIRLNESELNNLEDTLKDLADDENKSSKDINIEDLISLGNLNKSEES